ncbi:MAG: cytochrome c3 family protein [Desulfobacteraceae bacterium]|nr:cytochrome c3 family protein [Desulfobacteraceae bacterium]
MEITAPAHSQTKRSPVIFPHSTHFQFACKSCHHEWNQVGPVEGCAASGCHEKLWALPPGSTPLRDQNIKSLTGAYHEVCRDCHRKQLEKAKESGDSKQRFPVTGPIACDGCHPANPIPIESSDTFLEIPIGPLTITAPEGSDPKRSPVDFPHAEHFNYACQTCHHDWDGISPVQNCTVSGCHDQLEPDESTKNINDPRNSKYFLAAYHKACIKCHLDLQQQSKKLEESGVLDDNKLPKYGPVACINCHLGN